MKNIKQTRPATWLAGGAIALSANAADAALVQTSATGSITNSVGGFSISVSGESLIGFVQTIASSRFATVPTSRGSFYFVDTNRVRGALIGSGGAGSFAYTSDGAATNAFFTYGTNRGIGVLGVNDPVLTANFTTADGSPVTGLLDFEITGNSISAVRFIYDDADFTGAGLPDSVSAADSFAVAADVSAAAVPEPSSLALLALGAAGVMRRRNRKSTAA